MQSPPPVQVYSPPKKDMSWTRLPEFVDDTVTDYSRPTPSIVSSKSNTSDLQNSNSFVSEHEESSSSIMSKPMIKFVKAANCPRVIKTNKTETARKSLVKYAEMYRNTSKNPKVRGNQRNWNNLKSQQLGKDFLMLNKACYICGSLDILQYTCKQKRQLNHKREGKPVWNNARRGNSETKSEDSVRLNSPEDKKEQS
nr:retrotransposon Orf1 [Tanacetum cinerariifolium]